MTSPPAVCRLLTLPRELRARPQDDVGYHCGADVGMLSQFAGEREVLFPPFTMLKVAQRSLSAAQQPTTLATTSAQRRWAKVKSASRSGSYDERGSEAERVRQTLEVTHEVSEDGTKEFERVIVAPTFAG